MAYTPHVWVPRLGSNLNRFTKANETATSVDLTNAPEIVTQAGTPFSTDIMNEMEEGITDPNACIGLLATCATAAATQIKEINLSDYTIKAGMHIDIDFTNGNTVGSVEDGGIASGTNIVTKGAGEQIRIFGKNGTFLFNEKIGGEYAGSGCHNAGDCHEFVITTMATGNTSDTAGVIKNKDANDIYNVVGSSYSYRKQMDGQIKQEAFYTQVMNQSIGTSTDWTYVTTSFPFTFYKRPFVEIKTNTGLYAHFSYWGLTSEVLSITESYAIWRYRKTSTENYNDNGIKFYIN